MDGRLQLARNPFEAWTGDAVQQVFDLPRDLVLWAAAPAGVAQLVGATGMGKSTHLTGLATAARERGEPAVMVRLNRDGALPAPPSGGWWLLDEAQWLEPALLATALAVAARAGLRLALATHLDVTRPLRRARLTVHTWRLRGLRTLAEVNALWSRYLRAAGLPPTDVPLQPAAATALRRVSRGNPWAMTRLGYEVFEDLTELRPITTADLACAVTRLRQDAPDVLNWRRLERLHRPPHR